MAENCSIFCKVLHLDSVTSVLKSHFDSTGQTDGDSSVFHGREGRVRMTPKIFRKPGDDFCRLMLSTCAFVERMQMVGADDRKTLLTHIESCKMVIGVVAEPAFDVDDRYHDIVFAIAKALDGVVFNGREMLDANGETLAVA